MNRTYRNHALYDLMPAIYRERDAAEGYPLRELLAIIQDQAAILRADIHQLWDDFFIETCRPWVIAYIGDLVGNNLLRDADHVLHGETADALFKDLAGDGKPEMPSRSRADVAKTIYYRRRKGTLPMLEELARDVTGWSVRAVEFFRLLHWHQHLNHLRPEAQTLIDPRHLEPLDRLDGPFDQWAHTVDVRHPAQAEGWHHIANIGFFLWRLRSYPLNSITARQDDDSWRYHFSPLGHAAPLFQRQQREGDEAGLTAELHVPGPVRPLFFFDDLQRYRSQAPPRPDATDLYGPLNTGSFHVVRNGLPVTPAVDPSADPSAFVPRIVCSRLDPWPATRPTGPLIAVDVASGRLAVGDGWGDATENIDVSYCYGFSADMGGGPYERSKWLVDPTLADLRLCVQQDATTPGCFSSLVLALEEWASRGKPDTIITILDNRTYQGPVTIEPTDNAWLVIEAANEIRPHLLPDGGAIRVTGTHPGASLTLSGLLIEGGIEVEGEIQTLRILHTTLVPGRGLTENGLPLTVAPSLRVAESVGSEILNEDFQLHAAFSILGPLRVPRHAEKLYLLDSIVDGIGQPAVCATGTVARSAPVAVIERTTLFGPSFFLGLELASETIFEAPVRTEQCHGGCVRFSYLPHGSTTPRRYRCQPDFAIAQAIRKAKDRAVKTGVTLEETDLESIRSDIRSWLVPSFTALAYGQPGYAQLGLTAPVQVRTGAEDGSEMGAFSHLKQPQRETNLRIRLKEYLPFGLVPGLIFVT